MSGVGAMGGRESIGPAHSCVNAVQFDLKHLGHGCAVGSGRNELVDLCKTFDADIERGMAAAPVLEKIVGLSNEINNQRLATETFNGVKSGWGGYVEYAWYSKDLGRWRRGSRTLHFLFRVKRLDGNKATVQMAAPVVAYDPGPDVGRILAIGSGKHPVVQYVLASLDVEHDPGAMEWVPEIWTSWLPQVLVCTATNRTPKQLQHATKSRTFDISSCVRWQMADGQIQCGLRRTYTDATFKPMLAGWGLEYVPAAALPDDSE